MERPDYTWRSTITDPPPAGVVVEVANNGGARLKRGGDNGRLWFLADDSMYVYYTPEWWRPIA